MGEKTSWAKELPKEEVLDPKESEMIDTSAKVESLKIRSLYQIVEALDEIKEELRLQRLLYEKMNDISVTIEESDAVENTDTKESGQSNPSPPKPTPSVIPTNLKGNKEIEDYYRKAISDMNILDEKQLSQLLVVVEENYVRVKPPYLSDAEKFKAIASALRGMNGEYVKDGANTHYKMPKPATS